MNILNSDVDTKQGFLRCLPWAIVFFVLLALSKCAGGQTLMVKAGDIIYSSSKIPTTVVKVDTKNITDTTNKKPLHAERVRSLALC